VEKKRRRRRMGCGWQEQQFIKINVECSQKNADCKRKYRFMVFLHDCFHKNAKINGIVREVLLNESRAGEN
jgi:hypothetical protein